MLLDEDMKRINHYKVTEIHIITYQQPLLCKKKRTNNYGIVIVIFIYKQDHIQLVVEFVIALLMYQVDVYNKAQEYLLNCQNTNVHFELVLFFLFQIYSFFLFGDYKIRILVFNTIIRYSSSSNIDSNALFFHQMIGSQDKPINFAK
jgi:hypothetical protein